MITIYSREEKNFLLDWIIIGGGIQGCTVATFLLKSNKTTKKQICIIDPHFKPLHNWSCMTNRIGMEFLRSPSVHHIDPEPFHLQKFVGSRGEYNHFYGSYKRPSLQLFNAHCQSIFNEIELNDCWNQGRVNHIMKTSNGWTVTTEDGTARTAKHVVIAIGVNEQPFLPEWAKHIQDVYPNHVAHIYDKNSQELDLFEPPFLIIGGGITAAHLSITLSRRFPGKVILLKRHPFRIYDFDSDPGWLGPKNINAFHKMEDFNKRRKEIQQARHKGSIPNNLYQTLRQLQKKEKLCIMDGEVDSFSINLNENHICLDLKHSDDKLNVKSILLATGFQNTLPGQEWLSSLIEQEDLSCAACGYPIITKSLEWAPGLYVAGALAELEVGPVSRNIAGARKAAEKIISSIKK